MRIAIIGAGRVGVTLAKRWLRVGHEVSFGVRDPDAKRAGINADVPRAAVASVADAASGAEVVVLATPFGAIADAIAAAGDLSGKVVVDCTNPIGPDGLLVGTTTSGAEQVAEHAPGARVVKAFNTTGAENMDDPLYPDGPVVMPIAGDDEDAKRVVSGLADEIGFDVVDVGPLEAARYLEPMAMVWITLAMRRGMGRNIAFRLSRR